jgi:glycerophosphoryl diester phosphodiesterase
MRLYLLILITIFVGCSEDQLQKDSYRVIGHGGAGFDQANSPYPPNSLASIQQAVDLYGADGVEVDIQMTRDSQFVLFHDEYLQRSTSLEGKVEEYTLDQLEGTLYRFGPHPKESIISLRTLISELERTDRQVIVSLHIKRMSDPEGKVVAKLIEQVASAPGGIEFWFESEQTGILENIPDTYRRFIIRNSWDSSTLEGYRSLGLDGISVNWREVNSRDIADLSAVGLSAMLYGIRTAKDVRTVDSWDNVFAVQSDNLMLYQ